MTIDDYGLEALMEPLYAEWRLHDAWPELLERGDVYVPALLGRQACAHLAQIAASIPREQATPVVGLVHQSVEVAREPFSDVAPALRTLGNWFQGQMQALLQQTAGVLASEWPNEVTIAHYNQYGGITAHRDHARYKFLVAICSVAGTGRLQVVTDRSGTDIRRDYLVKPGDVVLLGAPGIAASPMHQVTTCLGPRISITFRYDAKAAGPSV